MTQTFREKNEMKHVKLLDCTLRDGAYLVDKEFGENNIRGIIEGLVKARIDSIEIGFFQNDGFGEGKTIYKNSAEASRFIPEDKEGCMFTVLADYSRYSAENLDECREDSVDAVRECFFKQERFEALKVCKTIKQKGYKLFVQPVDILGYTDIELIEFIQQVNEVEPYCLSIVDTFGSMYQEDLHRVFEIIHHNLVSTCKIGFHSHNNMQLSNALSQEFIRMTYGKREVVVDGTVSGMGRGAGNTPTELIAQYMVSQLGYNYDMDALLDLIDVYMDNIRARCSWGYSTHYFVAGCYSAHVNNIAYLAGKNSIRSKDIRYILNKIGAVSRKRYDYELLEKTYLECAALNVDDSRTLESLSETVTGKDILLLLPGNSATAEREKIVRFADEKKPVVISINFIYKDIKADYVYVSNIRRYNSLEKNADFRSNKKIIASNIKQQAQDGSEYIISFNRLIKCGWEHMDNSAIMVLRLLDMFDISSISIAGFDGFAFGKNGVLNYANAELELSNVREEPNRLNDEISAMLKDFIETRKHGTPIRFITKSRFSGLFLKEKKND